jgi:glycosyltransferase involved in cell wall biosynthesis
MVSDGVDGILVPPNSPEQLAAALLRLAADPALRATLGTNGRVRACESFAETLLAPRFATIYRAVLDGSPLPE